MKFKIPSRFDLGGLTITIKNVKKCTGDDQEDTEGLTIYTRSLIELAEDENATTQYKEQTFCHEWVHCMLDHIGYDDLDKDEVFVRRLSTALYQSIKTME